MVLINFLVFGAILLLPGYFLDIETVRMLSVVFSRIPVIIELLVLVMMNITKESDSMYISIVTSVVKSRLIATMRGDFVPLLPQLQRSSYGNEKLL
jgi:hypothetical protein